MPGDPVAVLLLDVARRASDELGARLALAAAVQRVAEGCGIESVVVGGTAADFYAGGALGTSATYPALWRASRDLDVVAISLRGGTGTDALLRALERDLGFVLERLGTDVDGREILGRAARPPALAFGVEIVSDELSLDPRAERVYTVEVEGQPVRLRGPEDAILAYAESGWVMPDARDWTRALAIAKTMRAELDVGYMRERAAERGMPQVLDEVLAGRPLPATPGRLR